MPSCTTTSYSLPSPTPTCPCPASYQNADTRRADFACVLRYAFAPVYARGTTCSRCGRGRRRHGAGERLNEHASLLLPLSGQATITWAGLAIAALYLLDAGGRAICHLTGAVDAGRRARWAGTIAGRAGRRCGGALALPAAAGGTGRRRAVNLLPAGGRTPAACHLPHAVAGSPTRAGASPQVLYGYAGRQGRAGRRAGCGHARCSHTLCYWRLPDHPLLYLPGNVAVGGG